MAKRRGDDGGDADAKRRRLRAAAAAGDDRARVLDVLDDARWEEWGDRYRESWTKLRRRLDDAYRINALYDRPIVDQRIVTPRFKPLSSSARTATGSDCRRRFYPPAVEEWARFDDEAAQYESDAACGQDCLMLSAGNRVFVGNESQESGFLEQFVFGSLIDAGIIDREAWAGDEVPTPATAGLPDFVMSDAGELVAVVEIETTQCLVRMPPAASAISDVFARGLAAVQKETGEVDDDAMQDKVAVCHPIGQLACYLKDNGVRYGVLSSATFSYFVRITGDGNEAKLEVSSRAYTTDRDFMRKWCYFCSLAKVAGIMPEEERVRLWQKSRKDDSKGEDDDDDASTDDGAVQPAAPGGGTDDLPEVPLSELRVLRELGRGRNGTAMLARWGDRDVAVKQFDLSKGGGEHLESELAAYRRLRDLWGTLVPEPLILSASPSGNVRLFGMQLGRHAPLNPALPVRGSREFAGERHKLERKLERKGVRQLDNENGDANLVYLAGRDGVERLAAIDLEMWD